MSALILASASPRRAELLVRAGFEFEVSPTDIDETVHSGEDGIALVQRLAQDKARACQKEHPDVVVLAADTVVWCDGTPHGKPADFAHYFAVMQKLSDQTHEVFSGVCVRHKDREQVFHCVTRVTFGALPQEWLEAYWASGEPQGCAGGYAIQGGAGERVQEIEGSYNNVVGLPVRETTAVLAEFGVHPAGNPVTSPASDERS